VFVPSFYRISGDISKREDWNMHPSLAADVKIWGLSRDNGMYALVVMVRNWQKMYLDDYRNAKGSPGLLIVAPSPTYIIESRPGWLKVEYVGSL
jgi:hypothetical protein